MNDRAAFWGATKSSAPGVLGRRTLLAGTAGWLASPSIVRAQGQNGVALVIGNSKYKWEASLPNVRRDVQDVAKRLQTLGLKVELLQNIGREAMFAAVQKFGQASRGAGLAAVYFAGHGASWENDTYLVPEDADLGNPGAVKSLLPVSAIVGAARDARHRLLVFDNCRNNPADGWRQLAAARSSYVNEDVSRVGSSMAPETLVLYSTAPGAVALDGPADENSPFAAAFLRQIGGGSVDLKTLPEKLRRDLLLATECRQMVWDQNTYTAPFQLGGSGSAGAGRGPGRDSSTILELPKAYAFAARNNLPLPLGLVASRPAGDPSAARLVGSYKWEWLQANNQGAVPSPALFIVLSVVGNSTAVVSANKDNASSLGARWRFSTLGVRTERGFSGVSTDGNLKFDFAWRDRDSGTQTTSPAAHMNFRPRSAPFTRLD